MTTFNNEQLAALEPVHAYFLGHAHDNADFMRRAFLPSAHIESIRDGVFTSWPLDVYCQRFKGSPAADEQTRKRHIDWIEVHGSAASARVTLEHGAMKFIDYFVLLKTEKAGRSPTKPSTARRPHKAVAQRCAFSAAPAGYIVAVVDPAVGIGRT